MWSGAKRRRVSDVSITSTATNPPKRRGDADNATSAKRARRADGNSPHPRTTEKKRTPKTSAKKAQKVSAEVGGRKVKKLVRKGGKAVPKNLLRDRVHADFAVRASVAKRRMYDSPHPPPKRARQDVTVKTEKAGSAQRAPSATKRTPAPSAKRASPRASPGQQQPASTSSPSGRAKASPKSTGADDVAKLSVKQLKALLVEKGIRYDDCVEKADLVQRLRDGKPARGRSPTTTKTRVPSPVQPKHGFAPPAREERAATRLDAAAEIARIRRLASRTNPWLVLGIPHSSPADARKRYKQLSLVLHTDKVPKHLAKDAAQALQEVQAAHEKILEQGSVRAAVAPPAPVTALSYERIAQSLDWTIVVSWKPPVMNEQKPVEGYKVYVKSGFSQIDQGDVGPQTGECGRVEYAISATRPHNEPVKYARQFDVVVQAKNAAGLSCAQTLTVRL